MHLPWPLVWAQFPEAFVRLLSPLEEPARLRLTLQTPVDGLVLEIQGPDGTLGRATLQANLSNPQRDRVNLHFDLPPTSDPYRLKLHFKSPNNENPSNELAAAIFSIRLERN
jgi:hypothetical protein